MEKVSRYIHTILCKFCIRAPVNGRGLQHRVGPRVVHYLHGHAAAAQSRGQGVGADVHAVLPGSAAGGAVLELVLGGGTIGGHGYTHDGVCLIGRVRSRFGRIGCAPMGAAPSRQQRLPDLLVRLLVALGALAEILIAFLTCTYECTNYYLHILYTIHDHAP
jgi:hypothetical protein